MQEPISIGHRGEHQPIVDRKLFDAVQEVQAKQRNNHVAVIEKSEALLIGLIYDDRGHRMTPVVAKKNGKQYRYYISRRYASNRASSHEVASNIEVRRNGIKVTARMTGVRFQKPPRIFVVTLEPGQLIIELQLRPWLRIAVAQGMQLNQRFTRKVY